MNGRSITPAGHIKPRVLTVAEAVAYTRIGRASLYKLLADGTIKGKKAGKKRLFEVEELDRFLDNLPVIQPGETVE